MGRRLECLRVLASKLGHPGSWIEGIEPASIESLCLGRVGNTEAECRIDPVLDCQAVTFAEMRQGHVEKLLTEAQLHQHWADLRPKAAVTTSLPTSEAARRGLIIICAGTVVAWTCWRRLQERRTR